MTGSSGSEAVLTLQHALVQMLHAIEDSQQQILFNDIAQAQEQLRTAMRDPLTAAGEILEADTALRHAHPVLANAVVHLTQTYDLFTSAGAWPAFANAFLSSRGFFCRALRDLYGVCSNYPVVESFYRLDNVEIPNPVTATDTAGIIDIEATEQHQPATLYVPEYYSDAQRWPLVVCLHGSHGRSEEYLWTWLRAARSRGYVVLSVKSTAATWSMMQPSIDIDQVMTLMHDVMDRYAIDRSRVYLSGLSDGATFSYSLGLEHADSFAGLAPIAGVLSPMTDPLLRAGRGKDLPIYVVHGALDMIFPIETVRSTTQLLQTLGYPVQLTELPDWGHALTTDINESLVLPWIEHLS